MKVVKSLLVAACFLGGMGVAQAQELDNASPRSYDQDKLDLVNNAKYLSVHPDEIAKQSMLEEKMKVGKLREGYLDVPGFTFTGTDADARNYAHALEQLKIHDYAAYVALLSGSN